MNGSRRSWQFSFGASGAVSLVLAASACTQRDATSITAGAIAGTTDDEGTFNGSDFGIDGGIGSESDGGTGSGSDGGTGSESDGGTGPGSDGGTGPGSDGGNCDAGDCDPGDVCLLLDVGLLDRSQVGQMTLDECDEVSPTPPSCGFEPVSAFFLAEEGCHLTEPSLGDLGNYGGACPTDIYERQELCAFAMQSYDPTQIQDDAEAWIQGPDGNEPSDDSFPDGFSYPNDFDDGIDPGTGLPSYAGSVTVESYWEPGDELPNDFATFAAQGPRPMSATDFYRQNQFERRPPPSAARNVVVLGSSMMSTHNQTTNGAFCSRASTRADRRGMRGNDFEASPAWHTRVPWRLALALGRTGFTSGDVRNAGPGARDACTNQWLGPASPMQTGVNWLTRVGTGNGLMVTDGGLINDQQSRTGGWSDTLGGLVACNAVERLIPVLNVLLAAEHTALNPLGVWVRGRLVARRPPTVRFVRWVPVGRWAGALDLPPARPAGRCRYVTTAGNGLNPVATLALLRRVQKDVPPLIRLWTGGPAGSPVPGDLAAIKNAYVAIDVKQIWLQYPYMDTANVVLRGSDLSLLWPPGVSRLLITQWGRAVAATIPAIDPVLRPRIRQVTDDLNKLMYDTIGCNAVAAFAAGHPARVCARNAGNAPRVVITRDAYAGWGPADHQDTIIGGMPHESAAGANKLGAAIVAADGLP